MLNEDRRPRIAVIDYGAGNLRSVARALETSGGEAVVTELAHEIEAADAVVLPGVGAAGSAMRGLAERGVIDPIRRVVASGRPFLGVCLGLQVIVSASDENGGVECLGIIPGQVRQLPADQKIPHIGWNQVRQPIAHRIFDDIPDGSNFYFVHSYAVVPDDPSVVIGVTDYGGDFVSAIARDNVVATQFHPEKSAALGLRVYRNFVDWAREHSSALAGTSRERA